MTAPQLFSNGEFELPVIPDGDSFRVNGNVVASQLGFRKASEMVRTLADDEKELIVGDVNPQVNSWAQTRAQSDQDVPVDVVVLVPDAGRLVVSGVRLSEIEVWP